MALVLYNGGLLMGTPTVATTVNDYQFILGTTSLDCCCGDTPSKCCIGVLTLPLPNLVLTLEVPGCPTVNGTKLTLVIDDPLSFPSETNCWRGTIFDIGGDPECFEGVYTLCCCGDNGNTCKSFCLTVAPSVGAGCFLLLDSKYPKTCSCTPLEFLFTGTVREVVLGGCVCCTVGQVINARITR